MNDVQANLQNVSNQQEHTEYIMQQHQMVNPNNVLDFSSLPHNAYSEANNEKKRISERLNGFNPRDNNAWKEISRRFGSNIKHPELLSIANVLASSANVRLDRDAKRRKTVLIKWFQENWAAISPFLDYVVLEDTHIS